MGCPVCGITMQSLDTAGRRTWWCPRCGTLLFRSGTREETESPLVVRVVRAIRETAADAIRREGAGPRGGGDYWQIEADARAALGMPPEEEP